MKSITTSNDKNITVYDDYFTQFEKQNYLYFLTQSLYRITGSDSFSDEKQYQIFSSYSTNDLSQMGLLNSPGFAKISQNHNFDKMKLMQIRVNLGTPFEKNKVHCDENGVTFLYYANLEWKLDYNGHTLFMNDDLTDAEYTCLFKPGRVVVFDGTIPHMIMPPTTNAYGHRFTFVIQYRKE
jgi:hypothetical protein